jgi:hypothetical protein
MADAATLNEQLTELQAAYATGALRVTHQGVTTEYRSLDDMAFIMRDLQRQLDALNPPALTPIRRLRQHFSKGL